MKHFKIKLTIISALFLSITLFNSCETEKNDLVEQSVDNEFAKFKSAFLDLSSKISSKNIQKVNIASALSKSTSSDVEGVTFPIIDNDFVIGRYIGIGDESIGLYIDFSDYTNKITFYDVNNIEEPETFQMVLDIATNTYKPVLDYQAKSGWRYWLCSAGCAAGATAISLVDGPAPLMDVLALAWGADCILDCADDHL